MAGILGGSGSVYYGIQSGDSDSILQKDDSSGNNVWSKNISSWSITGKSLVLSDDERYIYFSDTQSNNRIEIFKFNTNDGSFIKKFERYVITNMIIL